MAVFAFPPGLDRKQTLKIQQLEIMTWVNREKISVDEFAQNQVDGQRKSPGDESGGGT